MPLILNIDTAVQSASVCLADGNTVLGVMVHPSERESATWLHTAIQKLLREHEISLGQLAAVAISAGPGSYTGLRVGMATAKGLCYALSVPLISIPTLQMMAASVQAVPNYFLCPMIDARRMEVFTALYNDKLQEVVPASNLILEDGCFDKWPAEHPRLLFGNGSDKAKTLLSDSRTLFVTTVSTAAHMVGLSASKFEKKEFSNLAYEEPFYGKDFYSPIYKRKY
ncbi:MAG TPA: tRNA (adenosine(37)-N6)-threonylcarbamoyltransferase complex dimerization subunit type 1 TsaB [Flavisolibacter sp.]|jgi:tRNA threonylcarbamoyladenosine biosynthesis protein TsaB|nr:tRNA (adenosine(37)-N6)-threonylcarbamoyltransferase complex dimerization subunit type 1 TsaB [Flavisolibacter sp.]